jgi:hypothetical protein
VWLKNVNLAGGIISVSADGTRKRAIFEAVSDGLQLSDFVEATGGTAGVKSPTPADLAMKAAYKEEVVSRALHFLSQAKNWVNLYKVLDAMCDDLGSLDAVKKKNWVAAGEIGRFIGTANYHTAAAGEAGGGGQAWIRLQAWHVQSADIGRGRSTHPQRKDTHCNAAFRCGRAGRMDHDGDS